MASLEGTKTDRQPLTGDISVKHGLDGESVTITDITESTEDGGTNTVKFSDGSILKIKNGSSGKNGKDGKTAYQYAQDGGYTGTEEEFAVLMAQENLQTEKVSKLSEDIATKASAIKEKASGEVIVVTDSDEAKPLGLAIDGKSTQDGEPTPDNPIEIVNCGKYDEASGKYAVEVKGTGKNLLDCSGLVEKTIGGITYTPVYDENGLLEYIEANGTATSDSSYYGITSAIDNTFMDTILNGCPSGGTNNTYRLYCDYVDENGKWIESIDEYGNGVALSKTHSKVSFKIYIRNGQTANKLRFYPMVRPVGTDDTYEPYKETTTTVYLDEPLRKGDEAYWNGGSKVRVDRYRAVEVFDGSDDEVLSVQSGKLWYSEIPLNTIAKDISFVCNSYRNTGNTENHGFNAYINSQKLPVFYDSRFTDKSEVKTWLQSNPVEFEYQLAEPITEEIDIDLDGLSMFYPTTILSNDCNANMEIEYIADTKHYIDKKVAEIATAMV